MAATRPCARYVVWTLAAVFAISLVLFLTLFFTLRRRPLTTSPPALPGTAGAGNTTGDGDGDGGAGGDGGGDRRPGEPSVPSGAPCGARDHACALLDDFDERSEGKGVDPSVWKVSDGVANGPAFGAWWDRRRISVSDSLLHLSIARNDIDRRADAGQPARRFGKPFAAGEVKSAAWFRYGCFSARARAPSAPGVVSAMFLYTGQYDAAPSFPKVHNEIDVEFVFRAGAGRAVVQTNYFTAADGGEGQHTRLMFPDFAVNASMHTYGFKWTARSVEWFVDGERVRRVADGSTPTVESGGPMKLFLNSWPVSPDNANAQSWGGEYRHDAAAAPVAQFDWVRYEYGDNCSLS